MYKRARDVQRYEDFELTRCQITILRKPVSQQSAPGSVPPFVNITVQESSEVIGMWHLAIKEDKGARLHWDARSSTQSNRYRRKKSISTIFIFDWPAHICSLNRHWHAWHMQKKKKTVSNTWHQSEDYSVRFLLTRLIVSRGKGCHYSRWKQEH